jgi:outer membrane protein assembly factor BamB
MRTANVPMTIIYFLAACPLAGAQEWTRFRGPNGAGVSEAKAIPLQWTEKDFNWKVSLPGLGHSSPVLWGERLFLSAGDLKTGRRFVLCVDVADGKIRWKQEYEGKPYKMHLRNSVATATPAVDAERVYICWATPAECVVMALDHGGKRVWQVDLGPYPSQHGFGMSPILHDGTLFVYYQPDGDGALVAFDARTGDVRWKLPRNGKNATYSTPCVCQPVGRPAEIILTNWQNGITAVEAKSGKVSWELSVFDTNKQERAIVSPVIAGDLVLGTCGFITAQKHLVAVRPGDAAKGEKPKEVWRIEKFVPQMPTPVVKNDRVFLISELGIASWLRTDTGKILWSERIAGTYAASPVCIGDRLYCTATDGKVIVLAAADDFKELGRSELGEATQSTPAVAAGRIFFRTEGHLISLGPGTAAETPKKK